MSSVLVIQPMKPNLQGVYQCQLSCVDSLTEKYVEVASKGIVVDVIDNVRGQFYSFSTHFNVLLLTLSVTLFMTKKPVVGL